MGIYPRGYLMEVVRPTLEHRVLPTAEVAGEGQKVLVAVWFIAKQRPAERTARPRNPRMAECLDCRGLCGSL